MVVPQARLRIDRDVALGLLGEAEDHGEAETGALTDVFGHEERLEDALHQVGGHALAGVRHGDDDIATGFHVFRQDSILDEDFGVFRFEDQATTTVHGVADVVDQIEHGLLELYRVGKTGAEFRAEHHFNCDVPSQGPPQEHLQSR